jgi:hypothetical protein
VDVDGFLVRPSLVLLILPCAEDTIAFSLDSQEDLKWRTLRAATTRDPKST